ncbi:MAG: alpha-mannosidase, partial [bacterium]|nr:alpha-mannosidase [bacterium]
MPDAKPILHLVCNSHIDPVWIWDWQDGCLDALSTFRHAIDFLREYPELIFNHNEALLYEWVERHDPELFAAIAELVKAGRWNITGGWYLQPDCSMPEGETFVRLALYGRRYFQEKFGVAPTVSYNFDAFTGHNGALPQILRRAGFEFYIHCRPGSVHVALPAFFYRWRGIDGSEVYAYRPPNEIYCTDIGRAEVRLMTFLEKCAGAPGDQMFLWGVGDHGGGPTRVDLEMFRRHIEADDLPYTLRHSTPEAFLAAMKRQNPAPPVYEGDTHQGAMASLTSDAGTKRRHRRLDSLLHKAERYGALAAVRAGAEPPAASLAEAWRSHMLQTFHDVLTGTSIVPGIESVALLANGGMADASKSILASQIALTRDEPLDGDALPLFVFNPHPWPVMAPVVTEFQLGWRPASLDRAKPLVNVRLQ